MPEFIRTKSTVEAIQFNNINAEEIATFLNKKVKHEIESETAYLAGAAPPISSVSIETETGILKAMPSDWFIKETRNDKVSITVCKNARYNEVYKELLNDYVPCYDKLNTELKDGDVVDVQSAGYHKIYKKEDGQLYFKPYYKEERVSSYFSNDMIKA